MTRIACITLFRLALLLLLTPAGAAPPTPPPVGFQNQRMPNGTAIGIWYPAHGQPAAERLGPYEQTVVDDAPPVGTGHPLIVISHGTGGSFAGHADTAIALAQAGFIVAALTHPGDNWRDQSRATDVQARPVALSGLIGFMLGAWSGHAAIDPSRVGAFGFSSGGFTVLAAAGGQPDLSTVAGHCAAHPVDFDCSLLRAHPAAPVPWHDSRDARIKAIVVAAPALGFAFGRAGLSAVGMPVQLWRADNDQILPAPDYADAVRGALPQPPEFHAVPNAGHFDFLSPCAADSAGLPICSSAPGFDRLAFHRTFNAAVVQFFRRRL
jgi:predicted dienelactone hydrolase